MTQSEIPSRWRPSRWLVAIGALVAGLGLGLGVSAVAAQDAPSDPPADAPADGPFAAFRACAEDAVITLPDIAEHRRDREPLSDAERDAIAQAREACGDQLPGARARADFLDCMTQAGIDVPEPGQVRDWFRGLSDDDRAAARDAGHTCAQQLGLHPGRLAACRRHHRGR